MEFACFAMDDSPQRLRDSLGDLDYEEFQESVPYQEAISSISVMHMPVQNQANSSMSAMPIAMKSMEKEQTIEKQKESVKPIAKKIVKPSFNELIALQNPLGFWPETAKHIFDNFARNGDCHNFPKAAALIQDIEA